MKAWGSGPLTLRSQWRIKAFLMVCSTLFCHYVLAKAAVCLCSYQNRAQMAFQGIAQLKPDGTRRRTVGEVKGKHASGVGSQ